MQPRQIEFDGVNGSQKSECDIAEAILHERGITEAELDRSYSTS
jgi:hypothetical protein